MHVINTLNMILMTYLTIIMEEMTRFKFTW